MINIYAACCLLSALSIVELKTLDINRRVGENVTIECSDWNVWINVKSNVKYFCESPCSKDKHIIVKAAPGKTQQKKRIKLTNSAEVLFVTFTNLRKSDSKKYYCGAERFGHDLYIEVNLKVTDVGFSSPKTTPKTVIVAVTNSSTMSSSSSDINTDMSTSCIIHSTTPTAPATHGAGSVPYLIIGVIVIITILMVLLKLMMKMMKKQLKVVLSADMPQEDARENAGYEKIRPEDQPTVSQPAGVSTVCFSETNTDVDPDSLYGNYSYHQGGALAAEIGNSSSKVIFLNSASSSGVNSRGVCAESRLTDPQCDLVYSVAQLPKEQNEPTRLSEPNQSESYENYSLYSLAKLP
ncbi:uncharacterized protein LOC122873666 isoform X3 [Siniperca chuatsi]|nr:uncharacterized protein LOC122873666 isoform X3 [Siniperca chuatsi]